MEKTTGDSRDLLFDRVDQPTLFHELLFFVKSQLEEFICACSKNLALIKKEEGLRSPSTDLPDPGALTYKLRNNGGQIYSVFQIDISAQLSKGA
jgi:hypothetical protein